MKKILFAIITLLSVSCSNNEEIDDYEKYNIVGSFWESNTALDIEFVSRDKAIMLFSDPYELAHEFTYTLTYPTASFHPTENTDFYEFTAIFKGEDVMEITVYLSSGETETHLYKREIK